MTPKPATRDWTEARRKVEREGCRINTPHCFGAIQAAHTIGRSYDDVDDDGRRYVHEDSIVGLCLYHHTEYDAHRLDLLPHLTFEEQADAVRRVGLIRALARLTGSNPAKQPIYYHSADWHDGYQAGHAEAERFNADGSYRAGLVASQPKDQQVEEGQ